MNDSRTELDIGEISELLAELGHRLAIGGTDASIYLVGGAAIALELDTRRVTVDVDAVFHPRTTVRDVAMAIATDRGLREDWLSDAANAFIPGGDAEAIAWSVPGLAIAVASPRHLLAMKMAAYRPQDLPDLVLLFKKLGIADAEEAADISLEIYGEGSVVLPDRDELVLTARAVLDRISPPIESSLRTTWRLAWARTGLKNLEAVTNSARGVWALTEFGWQATEAELIGADRVWRRELSARSSEAGDELGEPEAGAADESGATTWKADLLDRLLGMPPDAFETRPGVAGPLHHDWLLHHRSTP